jgi:hypothetical protein
VQCVAYVSEIVKFFITSTANVTVGARITTPTVVTSYLILLMPNYNARIMGNSVRLLQVPYI